jgi:hypothetical protein
MSGAIEFEELPLENPLHNIKNAFLTTRAAFRAAILRKESLRLLNREHSIKLLVVQRDFVILGIDQHNSFW